MTKTKKSFMIAGGVLAIIMSAMLILFSVIMFVARSYIDLNMVNEILINSGEISLYTPEEIDLIVSLSQNIVVTIGIFTLGLAIATLVLSIIVIKNAKKGQPKIGSVIALLVFSILAGNMLTAAFMIVVLCLRNKKVEDTDQNQIIVQ